MDWHIILVAVAVTTGMHRMMEPSNLFAKLERLSGAIKTGKIAETQMKGIDTRAKSYAVGAAFMIVPGVIAYFITNVINPGIEGAIQFSAALTLITELVLIVRLDKWHVAVEKVTQSVGKK